MLNDLNSKHNLQDVNEYSSIAALLREPCRWTLNMPAIAISSMPVAKARNCAPTPGGHIKGMIYTQLLKTLRYQTNANTIVICSLKLDAEMTSPKEKNTPETLLKACYDH